MHPFNAHMGGYAPAPYMGHNTGYPSNYNNANRGDSQSSEVLNKALELTVDPELHSSNLACINIQL